MSTNKQEGIRVKKEKWVKIEKGFHGQGQKWQLGNRVFISDRAAYGARKWGFYEMPNNNLGQEIFADTGDFRSLLARFKQFIQHQTK